MAPAVVQAVAGSAAKDFKNESATARLLGSGRSIPSIRTIRLKLTGQDLLVLRN